MKKIMLAVALGTLLIIAAVVGIFWRFLFFPPSPSDGEPKPQPPAPEEGAYQPGEAPTAADIAAFKNLPFAGRYFGDESRGDLNFDGTPDGAFLVTQDAGTSTFFYALAAIKTPEGYRITNAFPVGRGIAPQGTRIVANELQIYFAERRHGESDAIPPSVGAVLVLKVTPTGVLEGVLK